MRRWSSEGVGPHTIAARLKRLPTLFTWEHHGRAELAGNLGNMDIQNQFFFASETTIRIRNKDLCIIMISGEPK
jgi:hypothetical protein